jgi:hypothetical protein
MTCPASFLTGTLPQTVVAGMAVEGFDMDWRWAMFLGAIISTFVVYLLLTTMR